MTTISPSTVLLLLALLVSSPHFNNASVPDACKAITATDPNINLNFCVTSLQSNSTSSSADMLGLTKIAVDLATKSAKSTKSKIKKLQADAAYADLAPEIHTCRSLYSSMVYNLGVVADALSKSNMEDAKTYLSTSLDAPCDCDDAFSKRQAPPVLSNDNETAKQLTAIALALISK